MSAGVLATCHALYLGQDPCSAPRGRHAPAPAPPPDSACTFGRVTNPSCPRSSVCARGPGQVSCDWCAWCHVSRDPVLTFDWLQVCGGKNNMFGVCADGLACSNCNR